jgi:hypothetical protein
MADEFHVVDFMHRQAERLIGAAKATSALAPLLSVGAGAGDRLRIGSGSNESPPEHPRRAWGARPLP